MVDVFGNIVSRRMSKKWFKREWSLCEGVLTDFHGSDSTNKWQYEFRKLPAKRLHGVKQHTSLALRYGDLTNDEFENRTACTGKRGIVRDSKLVFLSTSEVYLVKGCTLLRGIYV